MGLMLGEFVDEYTVKVGPALWRLPADWLPHLLWQRCRCGLAAGPAEACWLLLCTAGYCGCMLC